jgi:hypothetical protein
MAMMLSKREEILKLVEYGKILLVSIRKILALKEAFIIMAYIILHQIGKLTLSS